MLPRTENTGHSAPTLSAHSKIAQAIVQAKMASITPGFKGCVHKPYPTFFKPFFLRSQLLQAFKMQHAKTNQADRLVFIVLILVIFILTMSTGYYTTVCFY
jgi:hypothetical protein